MFIDLLDNNRNKELKKQFLLYPIELQRFLQIADRT